VPDYKQPFSDLRKYIEQEFAMEIPTTETCLPLLDTLLSSFDNVYGPIVRSGMDDGLHEPEVFGWLYRLPEEFNELLKEKHSAALMILACFVVLMKEIGHNWYIEGWVDHLMAGVIQFLGEQYKSLINWPIQQIRNSEAG
jgi:hypothetical protein